MSTHLRDVALSDRFDLEKQVVLVNGYQAIARMCLSQRFRDQKRGLNTAGYITGYRGSPLGGLDSQLLRMGKLLAASHITFKAGLNEDLAATALWGTQQAELRGEGAFDGVFGVWYGKGPGVDRSGDALRHANLAGTSANGGVIALMGDDHIAQSSTTAHQSEHSFVDLMIPILYPSDVQEIVDYGLLGLAMSRFAGVWTGLKCLHETIETTGIIDGSPDRLEIVIPSDVEMPDGGLNIRLADTMLAMEKRLHDHKIAAAAAFVRANKINRYITTGGPNARIGVITAGKSYLDVCQALEYLGINEERANSLGLRIFKLGCVYPINREELQDFASGLDLIIVVEEKRALIETQLKSELYNLKESPICIGKLDENGNALFSSTAALDPEVIALALGERLRPIAVNTDLSGRMDILRKTKDGITTSALAERVPYFCSGCPHNTSTKVPTGMRGYAGIGCHFMVQWMDRSTTGYTHMGAEGANWIGEALFSKRKHVFQNLGDGTYNHSGSLAIRAAVGAGVNMTYKILFNDAVALTGGQQIDGEYTVPMIAHQVMAEGVKRVVVVSDEVKDYSKTAELPRGVTFRLREDLDDVQRELAGIDGCTVLIYDQTCAAEKRRRRKRGTYPDPPKRVFINDLVCEGCGDCGEKSNCVSVQPLETEFGRKRTIDQSNCNKDFSCIDGFCPSFVTVEAGEAKKRVKLVPPPDCLLPDPPVKEINQTYNIVITGIGGTGIVTIGAIIGMAAFLDGKGAGVLDMAGLAQKGGAVQSHVKISRDQQAIKGIHVANRAADLVLGGDIIVTAGKKVLATFDAKRTFVVANTTEVISGEFTRNTEFQLPSAQAKRLIQQVAEPNSCHFVEATSLSNTLFGQSQVANIFLVGYAFQLGLLPLSAQAIEKAIELNGEAVPANIAAFRWGRAAAHDSKLVDGAMPRHDASPDKRNARTLDEAIAYRTDFLREYQNSRYAARYAAIANTAKEIEATQLPGRTELTDAVARYLFKLMAYKDEYEVARLQTQSSFFERIKGELGSEYGGMTIHLAPPLLSRKNKRTGEARKIAFGSWIFPVLRIVARFKFLRGSGFDPFGYTAERKMERQLIRDYEVLLSELFDRLDATNHSVAVKLASIPDIIRGFGHVKERNVQIAAQRQQQLIAEFRSATGRVAKDEKAIEHLETS